MNILTQAKQKCMPRKIVKFDKNKHKKKHKKNPWMTRGILNSINSKNKLYKTLLQSDPNWDTYGTLQTNYKTNKSLIRRSIMLAKRKYYCTTFNLHSNNFKKTWKTINEILNRGKGKDKLPLTLKTKQGDFIANEKKIANASNDFFLLTYVTTQTIVKLWGIITIYNKINTI